MIFLFITWVLAAIAASQLWDDTTWLAIVVVILAISYGVHGDENREHDESGQYSTGTATRLAFTFLLVAGIFLYSLII